MLLFQVWLLGELFFESQPQSNGLLSQVISLSLYFLKTGELYGRLDVSILLFEVLDLFLKTPDDGSEGRVVGFRPGADLGGKGLGGVWVLYFSYLLELLVLSFENGDPGFELHIFGGEKVISFWVESRLRLRRILSCCLTSFYTNPPFCLTSFWKGLMTNLLLDAKKNTFLSLIRAGEGWRRPSERGQTICPHHQWLIWSCFWALDDGKERPSIYPWLLEDYCWSDSVILVVSLDHSNLYKLLIIIISSS